jgi:asparagine synthase (glutamine-hydrolysing)
VPLGAFLSGGIDSTSVVALMQAASPRPVRSFTIGFEDRTLDEARHAAAVARHLGTEHTALVATETEALALVPRLAEIYDEPFADSSQIPTALVCALTRKHVTVALSGDGGDEVFAGYNRHRFAAGLGRRIARWPQAARQAAGAVLGARPLTEMAGALSRLAPGRIPSQMDDKLLKLAEAFRHDELTSYCRLVSQQAATDPPVENALQRAFAMPAELADRLSPLGRMQYRDATTYLPDDILTKVDRAAMAVALEVRVPLIDHRVVEFAWRLSAEMRVRNGETKWLLRRVLDRFVPRSLMQRPKQGFAVPLAAWLRGPLRDWASSLIANPGFAGGTLDPAPARALWDEHLAGRNRAYAIWPYLMFEAWRGRARADTGGRGR